MVGAAHRARAFPRRGFLSPRPHPAPRRRWAHLPRRQAAQRIRPPGRCELHRVAARPAAAERARRHAHVARRLRRRPGIAPHGRGDRGAALPGPSPRFAHRHAAAAARGPHRPARRRAAGARGGPLARQWRGVRRDAQRRPRGPARPPARARDPEERRGQHAHVAQVHARWRERSRGRLCACATPGRSLRPMRCPWSSPRSRDARSIAPRPTASPSPPRASTSASPRGWRPRAETSRSRAPRRPARRPGSSCAATASTSRSPPPSWTTSPCPGTSRARCSASLHAARSRRPPSHGPRMRPAPTR